MISWDFWIAFGLGVIVGKILLNRFIKYLEKRDKQC